MLEPLQVFRLEIGGKRVKYCVYLGLQNDSGPLQMREEGITVSCELHTPTRAHARRWAPDRGHGF